MKADPCLNFRVCRALNWRADDAPVPDRCPRCGGELLKPPVPPRIEAEAYDWMEQPT